MNQPRKIELFEFQIQEGVVERSILKIFPLYMNKYIWVSLSTTCIEMKTRDLGFISAFGQSECIVFKQGSEYIPSHSSYIIYVDQLKLVFFKLYSKIIKTGSPVIDVELRSGTFVISIDIDA